MLSIDLLISTMNYRSGSLDKLLTTVPDSVNVIVVNQVTDGGEFITRFQIRPNVTCHSFVEHGLSRSRNRLIALAVSEILMISDDDIEFLPQAFEHVAKAFAEKPEQDILTFQMLKPDGELRKRYKAQAFQHTRFSIAKVSSCEIAARRKSLHFAELSYDESFGLGAPYAMGEEVVFLRDCLGAGLKASFVPVAISRHPERSTGREFTVASEIARGAVFYRLYGIQSYMLGLVLYFRKRHLLAKSIGYHGAVRAYWWGINEYRNHGGKTHSDQCVCPRGL